MARADLHVHSCYSEHPSTWFLQRIGARESYVEPEYIYRAALAAGMDFVCITDHNCIQGALKLRAAHPDRVITGLEATTYFPEDGTKVHILVWGLDEKEFEDIERARESIYDLRVYLNGRGLAHAVAHATFSLNKVLTIEHVEKLLLLFDYFEGINGSRNKASNEAILNVLSALTPGRLKELSVKYGIDPCGETSWRKGVVGGSDDHSGLFIGKAYTEASAASVEGFIDELKRKRTFPGGRHNDYRNLAYAIYKVAYDFSCSRNDGLKTTFFSALNSLIFDRESFGLRDRLALEKIRLPKTGLSGDVRRMLAELIGDFKHKERQTVEQTLAVVDEKLSRISDSLLKGLFTKIEEAFHSGDIVRCIRSVSAALPAMFLSVPFFTTMNVMNQSRALSNALLDRYCGPVRRRRRRIVWFSDTLTDLNGVSETLTQLGRLAHERGLDLRLAGCVIDSDNRPALPPGIIELPVVHSFTPSFFNTYTVRIPSMLESLKLICEADPDEIYVSTPGPVGMLGVLTARLLHIPCTGVYHTDFTRQAAEIIGDDFISNMVEAYTSWAYSRMDMVKVPTRQYIGILEKRGFARSKMSVFKRGIDTRLFSPRGTGARFLKERYGVGEGVTFIHAGRVSREKSVDFLIDVFRRVLRRHADINLVFAGDGPYLEEARRACGDCGRIHFIGRLARHDLPPLYSACQALLFPSVTDTFGLVVLEAQACGLPAVVSDFGGPQEIIRHGKSGFVARSHDVDDWRMKIEGIITMVRDYPQLYLDMRQSARETAAESYSFDAVFEDIFGEDTRDMEEQGTGPRIPERRDDTVPAGLMA